MLFCTAAMTEGKLVNGNIVGIKAEQILKRNEQLFIFRKKNFDLDNDSQAKGFLNALTNILDFY
jgi:hypothetical protein